MTRESSVLRPGSRPSWWDDACLSARHKWVVGLERCNRITCQKEPDVLRVESCCSALGAAVEANPNGEKDQETGLDGALERRSMRPATFNTEAVTLTTVALQLWSRQYCVLDVRGKEAVEYEFGVEWERETSEPKLKNGAEGWPWDHPRNFCPTMTD